MDFGLIQGAAPASGPVPPADMSATTVAFGDAAAAFDAALSQTLGGESVSSGKLAVSSSSGRTPHVPWVFSTLFAEGVNRPDIAAEPAADGEALAAADVDPAADAELDAPDDDVRPEAAVAVPAPAQVLTDLQAPVVPAAMGADAPPANASTEDASLTAATAEDGAPDKQATGRRAVQARDVPEPVSVSADRAATSSSVQAAPEGDVSLPSETRNAEDARARGAAGVRTAEPATTTSDSGRPRQAHVGQTPNVGMHPPATERPAVTSAAAVTVPTGVVASSTGAGVAAASRAGSAIADARGTQHAADAPLTAGAAVPSFAPGSEAGMTGQHHPNGESRPSHEFMRFAAVLKQVAPAADEGGHAPVAAATPSAAPAQAPAAAVLSPAPSSAATETPGADNVGRLVQAMRVIARPGAWEANVRLNPEHLGDVSIAVRVERNAVTAVVNAESAGVCEWLESQEQAVRNGMAEHGLQLDRFVVQRDGQRREAPEQEQQQGRRARRGRQAATTERFEIVV